MVQWKPALFLIVSLLADTAWADIFQLVDRNSGYYVSYAPLYINSKLQGYTDKYGRIKISLPAGNYQGQVEYQRRRKNITLPIDGSAQLKVINVM